MCAEGEGRPTRAHAASISWARGGARCARESAAECGGVRGVRRGAAGRAHHAAGSGLVHAPGLRDTARPVRTVVGSRLDGGPLDSGRPVERGTTNRERASGGGDGGMVGGWEGGVSVSGRKGGDGRCVRPSGPRCGLRFGVRARPGPSLPGEDERIRPCQTGPAEPDDSRGTCAFMPLRLALTGRPAIAGPSEGGKVPLSQGPKR